MKEQTINLGMTKAQMTHLTERILKPLGVSYIEWQNFTSSGIISDWMKASRAVGDLRSRRPDIREAMGLSRWPEPTVFEVNISVDWTITLDRRLELTGCENLTNSLTYDGPYQVHPWRCQKVAIFHFGKGRQLEYDEVCDELTAYGYRPACVEELLSLSAQHTYMQRRFPIVGPRGGKMLSDDYWVIDSPIQRNPNPRLQIRRVGIFQGTMCDLYRFAAVRDFNITPTKDLGRFSFWENECQAVESEEVAMKSAYAQSTAT